MFFFYGWLRTVRFQRPLVPLFGYYVNAIKSWLLVKTDSLQEATTIFADTGLNITTSGVRHLGAPLGDASFSELFVAERVNKWKEELARLADIAAVQSHLAFCALTQGLVSRWTYLCRTADNTSESLRLINLRMFSKRLSCLHWLATPRLVQKSDHSLVCLHDWEVSGSGTPRKRPWSNVIRLGPSPDQW